MCQADIVLILKGSISKKFLNPTKRKNTSRIYGRHSYLNRCLDNSHLNNEYRERDQGFTVHTLGRSNIILGFCIFCK